MPNLAQRLAASPVAATVAMTIKARAMKAAGIEVIQLTIGEPDFDSPPHAIEAAHQAALRGETKYPPQDGTPALKKAIQAKFRRDAGLDTPLDEIMVANGGKQVIFDALMATIDPGDEVIVPAPYWGAYPLMTKVVGGTPVPVACPQNNGFKLRPEDLEAAITPKTKWLILNSPNNPTGTALTTEDLQALGSVLMRHPHVWIMSDDMYEHLVFEGRHATMATAVPELRSRTLTISGVSKTYAMTGWRIGFATGPKPLIKAMVTMQGHVSAGVSSIGQAAAAAALDGPQENVPHMQAAYQRRRNLVVEALNKAPGIQCHRPSGAFYVYPNIAGCLGKTTAKGTRIDSDEDFALALLEEAHVALVAGKAFGMSPYLRISYATDDASLATACTRIQAFCQGLHLTTPENPPTPAKPRISTMPAPGQPRLALVATAARPAIRGAPPSNPLLPPPPRQTCPAPSNEPPMLTHAQNDLITRTAPDTPLGALMRQYWQPAALLDELDTPRPVRPVTLLNEALVLFRDDHGNLGLIPRHCPHRGTDLAYGRPEHGGLRCPFHGWLFDTRGQCLEQPAEPETSTAHRTIRQRAYPTRTHNGIVFAYLGGGTPPPFPKFDCFAAPETHTFAFKGRIACNWLQALEVGIDPAHASYLHRFMQDETPEAAYGKQFRANTIGADMPMTRILREHARPKIEVETTPYGMQITALRQLNDDEMHIRVTNMAFPHAFVIPMSPTMTITQWHVPIDDVSCYWYAIFTSFTAPVDKPQMRAQRLELYTLPDYVPKVGAHNDYGFDPAEQAHSTYTGMGADINVHDQWAVESMGPIQDRTNEHLVSSDKAIAHYRRLLLRAINDVKEGRPPILTTPDAAEIHGPPSIDAIGPIQGWKQHWQARDHARRQAATWPATIETPLHEPA